MHRGRLIGAAAKTAVAVAPLMAALMLAGPAGAESSLTWSAPVSIDSKEALAADSCPSVSLCIALDPRGDILTSANPTGGAGAWSTAHKEFAGFAGLSCAAASLCVGVGQNFEIGGGKDVYASSNPRGGAGAWSDARVEGGNLSSGFSAVSCPSSSFCAAVGGAEVFTSTNPTGGAGAWHGPVNLNQGRTMAVSCPSAALCVVVDQEGHISTSTNPTGGAESWSTVHIESASFAGVSCPSESLCVAVGTGAGGGREVFTSTNPTGGASAWSGATLESGTGLSAVSCPSVSFCVTVGGGEAFTATNPAGGASAWSGPQAIDSHKLTAVSCPSASFCAAVDESGNVLTGLPPMIYRNMQLIGLARVPAIAYGQLALSSPQVERTWECVNLGFGVGWNEVTAGLARAEIISWWASGHAPQVEHTELGRSCRFRHVPLENEGGAPTVTWVSAEPPLHLVNQEGVVCAEATKHALSECPNESERLHEIVAREVSREAPSLPWNVEFTERNGRSRVRIGIADECKGKTGAERTELSKCPEASEREAGRNPKACEIPPAPAPAGCVRVQVLSNPFWNLHWEYEGYLEPLALNGLGNGLSPSSWEFEGSEKGEPVLRLAEFPPTEGSVTGSVKILGYSGQELLTVR